MRIFLMRKAFTLIELLVVIAIIAILAAILFPVFAQAKAAAKQSQCAQQIRQVNLALVMYEGDNDDLFPALCPAIAPINGGKSGLMPWDEQIGAYIKSDGLFRCPVDTASFPSWENNQAYFWNGTRKDQKLKRSYGLISNINTVQGGVKDHNTGISVGDGINVSNPIGRAGTAFDDPAGTLSILENWMDQTGSPDSWLGTFYGSIFVECDTRELPGRTYPPAGPADKLPDPCTYGAAPTVKHTSGTVYGFVDGHVKLMNFYQIRANDFRVFKAQKPSDTYTP